MFRVYFVSETAQVELKKWTSVSPCGARHLRVGVPEISGPLQPTDTRGLHSSTCRLNVSTFCETHWVMSACQ